MNSKISPASAAEARDEIRNYIVEELDCQPGIVHTKVVFNNALPWVDGHQHVCYLVEWTAGLANGVALAGPYTYNLPELSLGDTRQLGGANEWRQQLLNLYAGCEIAASARLAQPLVDVPDPKRTEFLVEALQDPTSPRIAVGCSVREFLRVGTDEYYILNGNWVHNPHFSYSPTFGFKPRRENTLLELPAPEEIRLVPHQFLQPVPLEAPEGGAFYGEESRFIMVKNGQVVELMASAMTRTVLDKVAMYHLLGQENGPFAIRR